jgi:hypothetical protein
MESMYATNGALERGKGSTTNEEDGIILGRRISCCGISESALKSCAKRQEMDRPTHRPRR